MTKALLSFAPGLASKSRRRDRTPPGDGRGRPSPTERYRHRASRDARDRPAVRAPDRGWGGQAVPGPRDQPLSWDTSRVTDMRYMFYVRCSPRPAPQPVQSYTSLRLGRTTRCPPPTSCSSAARGRAPRPSPPLAMAQAVLRDGPLIPAPEALTEVCVRPRQSLWRLPVYHSPQHMCVASTHLHRRERGATKPNEQRLRLPDKCSRMPI